MPERKFSTYIYDKHYIRTENLYQPSIPMSVTKAEATKTVLNFNTVYCILIEFSHGKHDSLVLLASY